MVWDYVQFLGVGLARRVCIETVFCIIVWILGSCFVSSDFGRVLLLDWSFAAASGLFWLMQDRVVGV